MRHVMLDIETMGTSPGSAIIQIGAAEFSIYKVGEPLVINVSLESCVACGLRIDASTVMWWMKQAASARLSTMENRLSLPDALKQFAEWVGDDCCVWGDGAAFDNVLLSSAYRACRMKTPWPYANDRCYRTMKNTFVVDSVKSEVLHNAGADAVAQAKQMQKILAKYSIGLM